MLFGPILCQDPSTIFFSMIVWTIQSLLSFGTVAAAHTHRFTNIVSIFVSNTISQLVWLETFGWEFLSKTERSRKHLPNEKGLFGGAQKASEDAAKKQGSGAIVVTCSSVFWSDYNSCGDREEVFHGEERDLCLCSLHRATSDCQSMDN